MPPSEPERALSPEPTRPPQASSSERRRTPRAKPAGLSYVKLEPDNGGRLLDVCESGIGFQVVAPVEETGKIQLWFVLDSASHIEVSGELAWIDDTKRSGGLKFTRPSKQARQQLRAWLSNQRNESADEPSPESTQLASAAQTQPRADHSHQSEFERELHALEHSDPAPLESLLDTILTSIQTSTPEDLFARPAVSEIQAQDATQEIEAGGLVEKMAHEHAAPIPTIVPPPIPTPARARAAKRTSAPAAASAAAAPAASAAAAPAASAANATAAAPTNTPATATAASEALPAATPRAPRRNLVPRSTPAAQTSEAITRAVAFTSSPAARPEKSSDVKYAQFRMAVDRVSGMLNTLRLAISADDSDWPLTAIADYEPVPADSLIQAPKVAAPVAAPKLPAPVAIPKVAAPKVAAPIAAPKVTAPIAAPAIAASIAVPAPSLSAPIAAPIAAPLPVAEPAAAPPLLAASVEAPAPVNAAPAIAPTVEPIIEPVIEPVIEPIAVAAPIFATPNIAEVAAAPAPAAEPEAPIVIDVRPWSAGAPWRAAEPPASSTSWMSTLPSRFSDFTEAALKSTASRILRANDAFVVAWSKFARNARHTGSGIFAKTASFARAAKTSIAPMLARTGSATVAAAINSARTIRAATAASLAKLQPIMRSAVTWAQKPISTTPRAAQPVTAKPSVTIAPAVIAPAAIASAARASQPAAPIAPPASAIQPAAPITPAAPAMIASAALPAPPAIPPTPVAQSAPAPAAQPAPAFTVIERPTALDASAEKLAAASKQISRASSKALFKLIPREPTLNEMGAMLAITAVLIAALVAFNYRDKLAAFTNFLDGDDSASARSTTSPEPAAPTKKSAHGSKSRRSANAQAGIGSDADREALPKPSTREMATALAYLSDSRGQRNPATAAQWLWAATRKGDTGANIVLADLYIRGDGVPQNCKQARVLLLAASKKGNEAATQKLQQVDANGCGTAAP